MTSSDVEQIHEASLRILDEVGVRLEHDAIVERVRAAGARPGDGPHGVRLPPQMVREHVALAPRRVELAAVQGVMGVAMADVPPLHRDFVGLRVIAEGTRKHARVLCFSPRGAETDHTFAHHRGELFSPRLLNRRPRNACPGPLPEVAAARVSELLAADREPTMAEHERSALLAVEQSFAAE